MVFVGCGSSGSKNSIDIAEYLPTKSMSKGYTHITRIEGKSTNRIYTDSVVVEANLIRIKEDENLSRLIRIKGNEVEITYLNDANRTKILKRYFTAGETVSNYIKKDETEILRIGSQKIGEIYTKTEESCVLEGMINNYQKFYFEYTNYDDNHDIMVIQCITKSITETKVDEEYIDSVTYVNGTVESPSDISYLYLQKGLGAIATINDDCIVSTKPDDVVNDTVELSSCLEERYEYTLYQPQY